MKGILRLAATLLAAALAGGCGLSLFEDVGTDPHPPEMTLLGVAPQPGLDDDGNTLPPVLRPPSAGITVRPHAKGDNTILLSVSYRDVGADILSFTVRDRDGSLAATLSPTGGTYFPGVSGETNLEGIAIGTSQAGDHRLEVWAEDSRGSRSAKATFTVTVQLY